MAAAVLLLAGCAVPPRASAPPGAKVWTGRLALSVEGRPDQSFSAGFELKGGPQTGELTLFNPLGGTLGELAWTPVAASLRSGGQVRQFPSVESLALEATGAELPLRALFDWLDGRPTPVEGWQVDVTQVAEGRLRARRSTPPPQVDLRVVLSD